MEGKQILWIFENWLDIVGAIQNEEDRARVWLLLIENVFGRRKTDLTHEKTEVQIAYNALVNLAKMRKLGGRKQNSKPKEEGLSLVDRVLLQQQQEKMQYD